MVPTRRVSDPRASGNCRMTSHIWNSKLLKRKGSYVKNIKHIFRCRFSYICSRGDCTKIRRGKRNRPFSKPEAEDSVGIFRDEDWGRREKVQEVTLNQGTAVQWGVTLVHNYVLAMYAACEPFLRWWRWLSSFAFVVTQGHMPRLTKRFATAQPNR